MMKKFILTVCGSLVGAFLALVGFGLCAVAVSFSIISISGPSGVMGIVISSKPNSSVSLKWRS